MDENDWLAERFEEQRTHLRAVAYRMLGSLTEADDAVQDAWVRVSRAEASGVENLGGWLTTIVARVCLNMLRSRNGPARGVVGGTCPRSGHQPRGRTSTRGRGAARRFGRLWRSRWCSMLWLRPSGWPSFSTTCSTCPSRRSPPWWVDPRPRPGSWRAGHGAGSKAADVPHRTPTSLVNARWSTPSSWPPAAATSTPWLPCSIPTSCCEPTSVPSRPAASIVVHGAGRRGQASSPGCQSGGTDPPRLGQRCGGRRHHAGRTASRRHGLHRRRRQDRRDRRDRRPRTGRQSRIGRPPQRVTPCCGTGPAGIPYTCTGRLPAWFRQSAHRPAPMSDHGR